MANLSSKIEQLTVDLNEVMRELSSSDEATAKELVEQIAGSNLVINFKASVDAMRHLVWLYIEAADREKKKKHPAWEDSQKLERATGILRSLHGSSVPEHLSTPESFLERIEAIVEAHAPVAQIEN